MQTQRLTCEVCVIGAGSAGVGAGVMLGSMGIDTILVEREAAPGGTSVYAGVNAWEPGVSGFGIHKELFDSLWQEGTACLNAYSKKVYQGPPYCAYVEKNPAITYERTVSRLHGGGGRVVFEPAAMALQMDRLLRGRGVRTLYSTCFVECKVVHDRITEALLYHPFSNSYITVQADIFIDCSADIHLAQTAGCRTFLGRDDGLINGISHMYRIGRKAGKGYDGYLPDEEAVEECRRKKATVIFNEYPNGEYNINVLPLQEGADFYRIPPSEREAHTTRLAQAHWYFLQRELDLREYTLRCIFPRTGIRQGPNLIGRYSLSGEDIFAGYTRQNKKETCIAFGDHSVDNHSEGEVEIGLKQPYGVPYECLLTNEIENLLVACRGSSFDATAASSCRLSRTMMALGEAAGVAAAQAVQAGCGVGEVDVERLRQKLQIDRLLSKFERERVKE